jgi:hypothetical protein
MDAVLSPPLSGIAQARFVAVGRQLLPLGDWLDDGLINQLIERETAWAESPAGRRDLRGESATYRASIRALLDLVRIGWRVEVERGTIELVPPSRLRARLTPQQVRGAKEETRRNLWPLVAAQLDQPEFRKFVRRLETPTAKTKTRSVSDLVASGSQLASRLVTARSLPVARRGEALDSVVRPYLQLVTEDARDAFTSLTLGEIWRYFRATWSIPNLPVPGRSMLYLVRDAAHPAHAVMGLIALNNAPMRKRAVDDWAGWTPARLRADAEARRQSSDPQGGLNAFASACVGVLRDAASAICLDGLATPEEIAHPDPLTTRRLLELGDGYYDLREKVLKDIERQKKLGVAIRSCKPPPDLPTHDLPPLDDHLPDLEKTPDPASRLARRLLIAKKRAHELSRLLQAQLAFSEHRTQLADPAHAVEAWARDEIVSALGVVCGAMKSARLSSNILEVTTCGAIAPYHHLLGGKLAALLCASPELGADYQARYGGEPAIIRSHMANRLVPADCRLAALVTTSLYGVGSSQYERVRLPAGTIVSGQGELRIRCIGESSGFGTVHFSPETMADLEHLLLQKDEFTDVNSVFGEGPSPKLRKLRAGLDLLGFSADDLLKHHQTRLVYALEYWPGAAEFLRWGGTEVPVWVGQPERFRDATDRIADFWRRRWLAGRLDHAESWEKLAAEEPWRLSDKLPVARKTVQHPPAPIGVTDSDAPPSFRAGPSVYERLAERRPELYSERLPSADLEQLHVETLLDQFIIDTLAAGQSLVLTGNAGDGKTHLFRRLQPRLPTGLEVIEDATDEMTDGRPEPVLDRIVRALAAGRHFVLCANEHQLLLLRETAIARGPARLAETFHSIQDQCRRRLVHGPVDTASEAASADVVVLDLSLRNPLARGFASKLLEKLLDDPDVCARAAADEHVGRNHRRLSHPQVRDRLLEIFDRLVLRGQRATVRQLWMILTRAVFAPDRGDAGDAPVSWYSEQVFDGAGRLEIDKLLARFADPKAHSHPRWDWHLIEAGDAEFTPADWPVEGPPRGINRSARTHQWFDALKRRFYFEHRAGAELFALDAPAARDFRVLLREGDSPEPAHIAKILRGINRLYCSAGFKGDDAALQLWQGLRYHEQPSRAYLAATSVPRERFRLERPRPPQRVAAAFGVGTDSLYAPDHLLLVARLPGETIRLLKLDFALFLTLEKVAEGLPRHLVPEAHIHRVDAFVERIGAKVTERGTDFLVFNAEDGTVTQVRTSGDHRRIEHAEMIS